MTEKIHMDEFFFFTYDSILKKLGRLGFKKHQISA